MTSEIYQVRCLRQQRSQALNLAEILFFFRFRSKFSCFLSSLKNESAKVAFGFEEISLLLFSKKKFLVNFSTIFIYLSLVLSLILSICLIFQIFEAISMCLCLWAHEISDFTENIADLLNDEKMGTKP